MAHWHYQHSGLHVVSDLALPEWAAFATRAAGDPDLTIRVYQAEEGARETAGGISSSEYEFQVSEVGRYHVQKSGLIELWPEPDADGHAVRVFLLGTAWAAFCHLRGLLVFHAAVVQVGDAAIAFCGESGAGKSTLAACLHARGYAPASDDLCRVEALPEGGAAVYPSASRLKLWRPSLQALGWPERGLTRDHPRMEKFHVPVDGPARPDRLPLRAIFLPVWGDLGLTRLSGLTALRRLIGAAVYRGELLEPMGRLGGYWAQCAELLGRVPVWELARPRDPAQIAESLDLVLAQAEREIERGLEHNRRAKSRA